MTTSAVLRTLWTFQKSEDLKPGELAALVGVDVSTVYRWRRGSVPVGLSLVALLEFLEERGLITKRAAGDGRRPSSFQAQDIGA